MENPSSQPQYFRFNDTPPEAPKRWFQRPEILRRVGAIVVVMLLLIGVGIFVNNLLKSMNGKQRSELEATRAEVVQRQADCGADEEVCRAQAQTEVARSVGIKEACVGLSEKYLQNCIAMIALQGKDASSCEMLDGEKRISCIDAVLLARAVDGEGVALCDSVNDASKKNSCNAIVTATARFSGDCKKYGIAEEVCEAQRRIEELLSAANFGGCAELGEEERVECIEAFTVFDGDGDGISVGREIELGTSDANADTDGDGYPDGEEVIAGYNPLK